MVNNKNMNLTIKWVFLCVLWFTGFNLLAQVSVTMVNIQPVNVTASELCRISVLNQGNPGMMIISGEIINSANDIILSVQTQPFYLESGLTNVDPSNLDFVNINYGETEQGKYVESRRQMPSGLFQFCVRIESTNDNGNGDSYCDQISSLDNAFLLLVNPEDHEVIETLTPMLLWMHSESFDLLSANEQFRLVLVELSEEQSAQSGISVNSPLFYVNDLRTHQIQYPFDAPVLNYGYRYGWQVQRISNDVIIDRTEAWEFSLKKMVEEEEIVYGSLKRNLDSGYYPAKNNKIYFKFDEKYNSDQITCSVYNFSKEDKTINSQNNEYENALNFKINGYNAFEIDLEPYKMNPGFYILEVRNEKNDLFKLKFLIE